MGNVIPDLKVTKPGQINGLYLTLYVAPPLGPLSFANAQAAHIFRHNKTREPTIFEGFDISVGAMNTVSLSNTYNQKLPKPYSDCVDEIASYGSVFTEEFAKRKIEYTKSDCFK